ncbi:MAG: hypothetical protein ABJJ53_14015 [Sulfitobacter sp.]
MRIKLTLCAATLALMPTLVFAAGCPHGRQVMSCAEGTVYDATSHSCIATTG